MLDVGLRTGIIITITIIIVCRIARRLLLLFSVFRCHFKTDPQTAFCVVDVVVVFPNSLREQECAEIKN